MIIVVSILLTTGIIQIGTNVQQPASSKIEANVQQTVSSKIEGEGFNSGKEAVECYIQSIKEQDLNKAISCFAIESQANSFDVDKYYLEKYGVFAPCIPTNPKLNLGKFSSELQVKTFQARALSTINYQFYYMLSNDEYLENIQIPQRITQYDTIDEMISEFFISNSEDRLTEIEINNYEDMSTLFESEEEFMEYCIRLDSFDLKEVETIVVNINIATDSYTIAMETGKYNGKWYIIDYCPAFSTIGIKKN